LIETAPRGSGLSEASNNEMRERRSVNGQMKVGDFWGFSVEKAFFAIAKWLNCQR
jgi:hypothetical protein